MKLTRILIVLLGLAALAQAQVPRISPVEAKDHLGTEATVCGKVIDSHVLDNGMPGYGHPVSFSLDRPTSDAVFMLVTFGPKLPKDDNSHEARTKSSTEAVNTYSGKSVCVTGKIQQGGASTVPFIMTTDHSKIKIQGESTPAKK